MKTDPSAPVSSYPAPCQSYEVYSSEDPNPTPGVGLIGAPDGVSALRMLLAANRRDRELSCPDTTEFPRPDVAFLEGSGGEYNVMSMLVPRTYALGTKDAAVLAHAMAFPADVGPCFEVAGCMGAPVAVVAASSSAEAREKYLRVLGKLLPAPKAMATPKLPSASSSAGAVDLLGVQLPSLS